MLTITAGTAFHIAANRLYAIVETPQMSLGQSQSFLKRHSRLISVSGALIVFMTYVTKEGYQEDLKGEIQAANLAESNFNIRQDLSRIALALAVGLPNRPTVGMRPQQLPLFHYEIPPALTDVRLKSDAVESSTQNLFLLAKELKNSRSDIASTKQISMYFFWMRKDFKELVRRHHCFGDQRYTCYGKFRFDTRPAGKNCTD